VLLAATAVLGYTQCEIVTLIRCGFCALCRLKALFHARQRCWLTWIHLRLPVFMHYSCYLPVRVSCMRWRL